MQYLRITFFLILSSFLFASLNASHIVGAELTYTCSGNNLYNVRLTLYRDCFSSTLFDTPIELYVFDRTNNSVFTTIPVNVSPSQSVEPENWDACVATPYDLCIERATYTTGITLPPNSAGYWFGWSRCCRNSTITNLANPQCEGVTFLAAVPPASVATCNDMPVFKNTPSVFLCAGQTYYFDYSATDADGDSLAYRISNPFTGLNVNGLGTANNQVASCGASIGPSLNFNNPMGPPPYLNVAFASGHSFTNPFGPGSYVTINSQTGYMEAFPANQGVYVMAVSVLEYRNGVLLSENKRDFQFHVIPCNLQGPPPVMTINTGALPVNGDTILVEGRRPFCFGFNVTDPIAPSYITVTPVSTIFGGNGGFPPPYATITVSSNTPPVNGQICWTPGCQYVGSVIPVVLTARDTNDCPNYNIVHDTIWIRIVPPPNAPPVVGHDLGTLNANGDTIILEVQENLCFETFVIDTLGGASLTNTVTLVPLAGGTIPQTQTLTTQLVGDTLFGQVCWNTGCYAGQTFMMITRGQDDFQCPPGNTTYDTVYIRVISPPNPPPDLNVSTIGLPMLGDTILAEVTDNFCFDFVVDDTSGISDSLGFVISLLDIRGVPAPGLPPTYFATGTPTHIETEVCWTPVCDNVDSLLMFVIRGIQVNDCQITNEERDTVYVRVTEPVKPLPLISHDLLQGPGNNDLVQVADGDTFCYNFRLQDTLKPTFLRYELSVLDQNGQPWTGAGPTITYTQTLDSLLEGEICWSVPCDLRSQTFQIVMVGRDTLDCRLSARVHDTVWVQHTENVPSQVELCNVSVAAGDAGVEMNWTPVTGMEVAGYVIFRRTPDNPNAVAIDTVAGELSDFYLDTQQTDVDASQYCYKVQAIDQCGNVSSIGNELCTILLEGSLEDYVGRLEWVQNVGWNLGVATQEIYRNYPELPGNPTTMIKDVGAFPRDYQDNDITEPRDCYRIRAIAAGNTCAVESWSNEICLNFPATLFVPTAFTPNGDGINDNFTNFGKFEDGFLMQVFDRWGALIFETNDPNPGWLGDYRGKPCPEGVYVYRMVVTGYDGKVLERHGSVTLLR